MNLGDSLLPANATALERELESIAADALDIPVDHATLWNPDTCPTPLLPWLAWAVSVDFWEPDWSEQERRAVIRESIEAHRIKGTPSAVLRFLELDGWTTGVTLIERLGPRFLDGSRKLDGSRFLETPIKRLDGRGLLDGTEVLDGAHDRWWRFRIIIELVWYPDRAIDAETIARLARAVELSKNARSIFNGFTFDQPLPERPHIDDGLDVTVEEFDLLDGSGFLDGTGTLGPNAITVISI